MALVFSVVAEGKGKGKLDDVSVSSSQGPVIQVADGREVEWVFLRVHQRFAVWKLVRSRGFVRKTKVAVALTRASNSTIAVAHDKAARLETAWERWGTSGAEMDAGSVLGRRRRVSSSSAEISCQVDHPMLMWG